METFQILSDQFSHFQHLFHRWLAIFCIISSYIFDLSSSPHTWGIHPHGEQQRGSERFIPTYVGYTYWLIYGASRRPVHPHIRGAYVGRPAKIYVKNGSSPHTWGIRLKAVGLLSKIRFIPTYVGHTASAVGGRRKAPVHPHLRGAYSNTSTHPFHAPGSSPPRWGIHACRVAG